MWERNPPTDDARRFQEKAANWLCAVGEKMMLFHQSVETQVSCLAPCHPLPYSANHFVFATNN